MKASASCLLVLGVAVACGGSGGSNGQATGGTGTPAQGGESGSSVHRGGNGPDANTGNASSGAGGTLGGSSGSGAGGSGAGGSGAGGSGGAGAGGAGGSGGAGGRNAAAPAKCGPAQIYCNGSCLQKVGDSANTCSALFLEDSQTLSLAAEGGFLYFTHANVSVDRMDLTSLATSSLLTGIEFPGDLLVDGDTLYLTTTWTEAALGGDFAKGTVRKVAKIGGTATFLAGGLDDPRGLVLSGGSLYFVTGILSPLQLLQESVGGPTPTALGGALAAGVEAFHVDAGTVYYSNSSGIVATPLADLSQAVIVSPNVAADALLSDANNLYFFGTELVANQSLSTYNRVDKSGGAPQIVHLNLPLRFRYRDGDVCYLVGPNLNGEQKLYRMPLDGSSLVPIATFEHDQVVAIAADASYVYVGLNEGGIARVAK